ncbi:MAG: aminotransferase class V-fold PLP-dependent enzyme [Myxococcales bacterium]|nr:aminotransferase class V-fold PLP-dependent enzyme [Myxococcales bacterium]
MPSIGSRALFPDLDARVYLNHASISPPSRPVREAVVALLDRYGHVGTAAFPEAAAQRDHLRASLGTLMGCEAEDIALTGSTTRGIIDLSVCLHWEPGDRIVCFRGEFPANTTPWLRAAAATGAEVVWVDQDGLPDEAVVDAVRAVCEEGDVRMVACSLVQFATGRVMPVADLAALAHAHGAYIAVDAIQGLGVVPVDVRALDVDFLLGGGHKWLMGLEGVGFAYVHPRALDVLEPRTAGWLSHEDPLAFLLEGPGHLDPLAPIRHEAGFLEAHSGNALGCAALDASVAILLELGVPAIHAHVTAWLDAAEDGLVERGFTSLRDRASSSGTLSLLPPDGDAIRWNHALNEAGISVSAPDGRLRLSPHWPNALDEVDVLLATVDGLR